MSETHESSNHTRCYRCFRPHEYCICEAIPQIDNQTSVLILQHARERPHRFNTARIVKAALQNSILRVGHVPELASTELPLLPRAGLLFPGPDARLLSDLAPNELPEQLVVLDGTWHHAKTFVRDIPAIGNLPRYMIAPDEPGRYRIRREPTSTSLSTLEATVAALKVIEPQTEGLDRLLEAFDLMIERQIAHPNSKDEWRRNRKRSVTEGNIPRAFHGEMANVVVAYGESTPGQRGDGKRRRAPVYWTAERIASGESFASTIVPDAPLSETTLGHLELSADDFASARTHEAFRAAWALEETLADEGIEVAPAQLPGRAGRRLAMSVALVKHFNKIANRSKEAKD